MRYEEIDCTITVGNGGKTVSNRVSGYAKDSYRDRGTGEWIYYLTDSYDETKDTQDYGQVWNVPLKRADTGPSGFDVATAGLASRGLPKGGSVSTTAPPGIISVPPQGRRRGLFRGRNTGSA